VTNFDIINNLLKDIGLHLSVSIDISGLAMRAQWHVSSLDFHILYETCVAQEDGALRALLRVHWHLQADKAPHDFRQLFVVDVVGGSGSGATKEESLVLFLQLLFFRAWSNDGLFLLLFEMLRNLSRSLIRICWQLVVGSGNCFYANDRLLNLEHFTVYRRLGDEKVKLI
jgi:hypothetical protein